jgi:threonine dehydratase
MAYQDCTDPLPQFSDIIRAQTLLQGVVKQTPLERSKSFSAMTGAEVFLKLENLQSTGSFKVRGAYMRILHLSEEERARGVICASAGNHAQGVAYAASQLGVKSKVFMPVFAPPLKVVATRAYGAEVVLTGRTFDDALKAAIDYAQEHQATFVHPFNHPHIIAGAGTLGLEIFESLREVNQVLVPIGGGGLIAGVAIALKHLNPAIQVIGVEASGAQGMKASLAAGEIRPLTSVQTIADGIAVKAPGNLTLEAARRFVDDVVVVEDREIARAAYLLLQRAKTLAEPAGVAAMAAVLFNKVDVEGKCVVPIISGGNINMSILEQILDKGVMEEGFRARIAVLLPDQAGKLQTILSILEHVRASVHEISHERSTTAVPVGFVQVTITFNLQDTTQLQTILAQMDEKEMEYRVLG